MKSDTSKHVFWKLAIVKELLKGNDNQIRAARVSVTDPQGGTKLLRRSIKHLYPIEVNSQEDSSVPQSKDQDVSGYAPSNSSGSALQPEGQEDVPESVSSNSTERPRRQAAITGEELLPQVGLFFVIVSMI